MVRIGARMAASTSEPRRTRPAICAGCAPIAARMPNSRVRRAVVYDTTPQAMDEQIGFLYPGLRDERLRAHTRAMEEEP